MAKWPRDNRADSELARRRLNAASDLERLKEELEAARVALQLPPLNADLASGEAVPELDDATIERLRELGYVQ